MISNKPIFQTLSIFLLIMLLLVGVTPVQSEAPAGSLDGSGWELPVPHPASSAWTSIDTMLDVTGSISGTVYETDGATPLANIFVNINGNGYGASACTNASGQYSFSGLPLDVPFQVQASPPWAKESCGQWSNYVQEFWQEASDPNSASLLTLTIANPDRTEINFTLDLGGVISGTTYEADGATPLPHISISFQDDYISYNQSVCSDENGHYEFHGMPFDMPVRVRADSYRDSWCDSGGNYISEFWQEAPDSVNATVLTVTALASTQTDIDFSLDLAGSISGTVYEADGVTPIPDLLVSSFGNNDFGNGACTDSLGHYTIQNVPFGQAIYVYAGGENWCGGSENYAVEFWQESSSLTGASLLTASAQTSDLIGIDFTLDTAPPNSSNIFMRAWYVDDVIEADNWPVGTHLTLDIEDMTTPISPDHSMEMDTTEFITLFNLNGQFDVKPGMFVIVSGASVTKIMTVADVAITNIDQKSDTITGTAPPNSWMWMFFGPSCIPTCRSTVANGSGIWVMDFSVRGPDDQPVADIGPGSTGAIHVPSGGGSTSVEWFAPLIVTSIGMHDGWILESSETSGVGGTMNATAPTLSLGDDPAKKQYRSILSFKTNSLPDTAVITKVTLKLKRVSVQPAGTNPISLLQGIFVDVRKGFFGSSAGLQLTDFQDGIGATGKTVGPFKPALSGGWYTINLNGAINSINKLTAGNGLTQIRLRFKLDHNNNFVANILNLASGNHATAANRPQLIIEYYVP